jgi:ice-binding like protein/Big-like domain-containing protein
MSARSARVSAPLATIVVGFGVVGAIVLAGGSRAGAAQARVGLGTAASFAVLGGSTVTNTGDSVVNGNLGVSPGTAITGFGPGQVHGGVIHNGDTVAANAQADATIAYNDAASRANSATITSDLGGQTLVAGVYTGTTLGLTGTLTLNGNSASVFIFRSASTLITAPGSAIALTGGAQACNVFWQIGSSATLDTTTAFIGTVLAQTSITANHGATVAGRLLASTGAVTLDDNIITRPTCAAPPVTSSAPATTSAAATGTAAATSAASSSSSPVGHSSGAAAGPGTTATTTTLTASPNPISPGGTVTVTAVVTSPGRVPTGSVTIIANGVPRGTATLDSSGHARFVLPVAASSTAMTITAHYSGAGHFASSTSAAVRLGVHAAAANTAAVNLSSTTGLASTGARVSETSLAGLLAVALGGVTLLASRRPRRIAKHRR